MVRALFFQSSRIGSGSRSLVAGEVFLGFGDDFAGKGIDFSLRGFPRARIQTGFSAGLLQKPLPGKTVLRGHLGKKQATTGSLLDEQSMTSELKLVGDNAMRMSQERNLEMKVRQFPWLKSGKPRVFPSSAYCAVHDAFAERLARLDHANAAPQPTAAPQRYKNAAPRRKDPLGWNFGGQSILANGGFDGVPRQSKQRLFIGFREWRHPAASCDARACAACGVA